MVSQKKDNQDEVIVPCLACNGYGYTCKGITQVPDEVCWECGGKGYVGPTGNV